MSGVEPAPTVAAPAPGLWSQACLGDRDAFRTLAQRFWHPVYVWFRAGGVPAESAAEQCRGLLTHLHASEPPARDEPTAARFREFLLAQMKAFTAPATKGPAVVEFDAAYAAQRFELEPIKPPEEMFLRRWALRVLELAVETLQHEYASQEKSELFDAMKPFLGFQSGDKGYGEAARAVDMSASAFHLQVFGFRQRYRAILRGHIGDTLRHQDDVDSELTALLVGAS